MKKLISALSSLCLATTSLFGAFPAAITADVALNANAAGKIVYNLIPHDKEYESAASTGKTNNVYKAKPGEELVIDWTVQNDQGTAGIQMNFDFTAVEYVSARAGRAYRITPTYSDYKSGKGLKQGEATYTWAQDNAVTATDNAVIYSFTVNVPSEKGTYSVGLDKKSGLTNKAIPKDQTQEHEFDFYGLDIEVGGGGSPQSTDNTNKTPDASTIIYNLVPSTGDYESAEKSGKDYNVYKMDKGGELQIDWTVKNDQGTAGIQMNLDFTQVEYVSAKAGKAYRVTPTYSDYKNSEKLKQGEATYTFAQDTVLTASDNAVIYSFTVNVPDKKGTYRVGMDSSNGLKNKVIPKDQSKPHSFKFYGLDIEVAGGGTVQTSESTKSTNPKPGADTIIYNLIPSTGNYESAEKSGKDNNVFKMDEGGELTINWTVKNDQGTAGIQMNFDFTSVEYVSAKAGKAYRITPTYSDYKSGKGLDRGEATYTWAQDNEAKAADDAVIYTFTVNVPNKKGTYNVGLDRSNGLTNKAIPKDQTQKHEFVFYGLDIEVGGGSTTTTDSTKSTNPKPGADTIIYNLIPSTGDYESAEESGKDNNVFNMDEGGDLQIDWTIKNDQGTAGIQMNFDFTEVTYNSGKSGKAYRITPTYSDYKSGKGLDRGEATYTWAQDNEAKAADNAVIYSFNVTVPDEKGTYIVGLDRSNGLTRPTM